MVMLKIILWVGLLLTDLVVVFTALKSNASCGDPKSVVSTKKQLQIGIISNLLIVFALIGIYIF